MKTGKTNSHVQTVEVKGEKFELELPEELNIKPRWEIKVSRNCTMLIYDDKTWQTLWVEGQQRSIQKECFAFTVLNADGQIVKRAFNPYANYRDGEKLVIIEDLLDLMHEVKAVARRLVVKKKTTKVVEEDEDEY